MSFFSAFFSLGYSGIVLLLTALFVGALAFNGLGMHKRGIVLKVAFFAVLLVGFVAATLYLAQTRADMMDALRETGGPKLPSAGQKSN